MSPVYVAWTLLAATALLDWYAVLREDRRLEAIAKPAALASLILVALALGAAESTTGFWLLVALAFGLVGDVCLLSGSLPRFKAGLAAFLVGHLAYVVSFWTHGLDGVGAAWPAFLLLVVAVIATREVLPTTYQQGGLPLAAPVAGYTGVIGLMLVAAWATGEPLVAAGATVFVASDSLLSVDRFVRKLPRGHLMVMVTYHLGQALIVAGLLA